ncbi:glycosyltransferase involved in cell wall biosynthesis [Leucobacter komagatae]|uniref:Glycosyltransferase involved in cell wall biosynthesis n=1 Tax=Leucobacter komagatae TaxID=55969 RepID=A0A542XYE5_9MICO|nr:glycosyltransferase family 4 protein [Leucobacter komagatae]TQL40845.1 glycosyltransferase involved in cell wall biosynthesis [Leucobacter komagatae]
MLNDDLDLQLSSLLSRAANERAPLHSHWIHIEALLAEALSATPGGKPRSASGGSPDLIQTRAGSPPLFIEIQILAGPRSLNNLNNRSQSLLAHAIQMRRSTRAEVTLAAVLLLAPGNEQVMDESARERATTRAMHTLLRNEKDNVGYDAILLGELQEDQLIWEFYKAGQPEASSPDHRPTSTTQAFQLLATFESEKPFLPPTADPISEQQQRFLLVADEWRSGRGGISTVNRELAAALASIGKEVTVLLPDASDEDIRSASAANVSLATAARPPGISDREALMLRPIFAEESWAPDVIVGHGRILGPYAATQQQQFFPSARRVHIVHTDAEQLEFAKETIGGSSRMTSADERRQLERELSMSADLVAGIGPLLSETISDDLLGNSLAPRVFTLVPGMNTTLDLSERPEPVKNKVLFIGRADDMKSKGIDIVAEALLQIVDQWPASKNHIPSLIIRGVPSDAANVVKRKLDEIFESRVTYHLRPYADDQDQLLADLSQARVLLMPSRHEGFGLAGLEAIAKGIPVLLSAESGLAQLITDCQINTVPSSIVSTRNTPSRLAVDAWAEAIRQVLDNPKEARARVIELRSSLAKIADWPQAAASLLTALDQK